VVLVSGFNGEEVHIFQ